MNTQVTVASTEDIVSPATVVASPPWAVWRANLAVWLSRCADQWDAAAAYEELSRLSDAQLEQRGLRRDTLASDLTS